MKNFDDPNDPDKFDPYLSLHQVSLNILLFILEATMEVMALNNNPLPHIKTSTPCLGSRILTNYSSWAMYLSNNTGNFSPESRRDRSHLFLHPWSGPFHPLLRHYCKIDQTFWDSFSLRSQGTRFQQERGR